MATSMKPTLLAAWLLILNVSAVAQQRTVNVRLFWLHPPARIRIEPNRAMLKSCASCVPKRMDAPVEIGGASRGTTVVMGRARILVEGSQPFPVSGELTVQPRAGILLLTIAMPLEEYVAAVLAGESAGFKSDEALKAMAVAARTYAVYFKSRHTLEGFDFCDTTHCQDVRLGNESSRVHAAVTATEGELLWYQGRPAATYYHRSCGGELEDASALDRNLHAPYLRKRQDLYCPRSDEWQTEITVADLAGALAQPVNALTVESRTETGRVRTLLVNGKPLSATDFRLSVGRALGWEKIPSDLYQLEDRGGRITLRGRGQGHGVGLCQAGADSMGKQGRGYREILAYYYPGTALGISAQGLAWQKLPGATVDIVSTNPSDGVTLLPVAENALRFAISRTGWTLNLRPQVKVFPNIAIYRDATGEPGWVAASTRGDMIRLQPMETLKRTNVLDATLRHEFLHLVVESQASPRAPRWLREGLVIYLENPSAVKPTSTDVNTLDHRLRSAHTETEMRGVYRACVSAVADLVSRHGLPTVLGWVKNGPPPER
jgi:stage II sporulation protein D